MIAIIRAWDYDQKRIVQNVSKYIFRELSKEN